VIKKALGHPLGLEGYMLLPSLAGHRDDFHTIPKKNSMCQIYNVSAITKFNNVKFTK
jgi:hypothetical protein